MSDILKEAIADAKAVRETALQNAKLALEEAFTPQLKSMLSAKLKEDDMDDEDDIVVAPEAEDDVNIAIDADGDEEETPVYGDEPEMGAEEPVAVGEPEDDEEAEEGMYEDTLDLESIIRELETELAEEEVNEEDDAYDEKAAPTKDGLAEEDDAYPEAASKEDKNDGKSSSTLAEDEEYEIDESALTEDEDEDEDEEKVDEQSDSSEIGKADNKVDVADAGDEEDPGKGEMHEVKAELKEYKEAVIFLKDKLHEVNILNAKLLFTNKLFKEYSLNNNQKLKVVETFDRAQTTREIKLVYSTLAEQFGDNSTIGKKSIKESASSAVGSTKPSKASRKVITEETEVANRFKKLAGLL